MRFERGNPYWDIKVERYPAEDGFEASELLNLLDPEKHVHAYVKWDDSVHLWYYQDNSEGFDHDTGIEDHTDWGFTHKSNHDLYRIIDVDEEIARLQSLKDIAVKWFAERGKRWPPDWEGYRTGKLTIEQAIQLPVEGQE